MSDEFTLEDYNAWVDACVAKAQERSGLKHCCKAGCSHCCSEPAYADRRQIDHIIAGLTPEQIEEVKSKLPEWIAKTEEFRKEKRPKAHAYRFANIPCPLLKDGLCIAYERRPMDCRIWFAIGNPEDCKMPARKHQKFAEYPDQAMDFMMRPFIMDAVEKGETIVLDHIAVLLAERLLNIRVPSAARREVGPQ